MKTVIHKANTRGHADHGWLNSYHTFSFANYYDANRVHFGALRVLNDDTVEPGQGFGTHPHDNMEIISIPLSGDLAHKDSMGNTSVIKEGDIQVMSAGTGIFHSEFNHNDDRPVKFLQIWVYPNKRNVGPRYDQIRLSDISAKNSFYQVLSPDRNGKGVWIYQDAWFYLGEFDTNQKTTYHLKKEGNGIYVFVLEGQIEVNGQDLENRDGLGIWEANEISVMTHTSSKVLLMEVPMSV